MTLGPVRGTFVALAGVMVVVAATPQPAAAQGTPLSGPGADGYHWQPQATLLASDGVPGEFTQFGSSAALDGDTALIGAPAAEVAGTAFVGAGYVYVRTDDGWHEQAKLTPPDGSSGDAFGTSVALAGDTALVGSPSGSGGTGEAWVFTWAGDQWTPLARLASDDPVTGERFGHAVALDGDTALVGAQFGGDERGAVQVFRRVGGQWTHEATLTAADGDRFDHFGSAVALAGDTAVVGAPQAEVNGAGGHGAVYVFTRSGTDWTAHEKLAPAAGSAQAGFGNAVALDGSTAVVGAWVATVDANLAQGAAYVFADTGDGWHEQATLLAEDGDVFHRFGYAVALAGDTALVGAVGAGTGANLDHGAGYLFTRDGSGWHQQARLVGNAPRPQEHAGTAAALTGDTAVVGAFGAADFQGAAHVYTAVPTTPAPQLALAPAEIAAELRAGATVTQELTIGNAGTADLPWRVFEGEPRQGQSGPATTTLATSTPPPTGAGGTGELASAEALAGTSGAVPPALAGTSGVPPALPRPQLATPGPAQEPGLVALTHSASPVVEPLNSLACLNQGQFMTNASGYLRAFTLEDFLVFSDFHVTEVSFGVEWLAGASPTVTVNLFTVDAEPLRYDHLTMVGAAEVELAPQELTTVSVPVTGTVPAGATLVVEVAVPQLPPGGVFFAGSNPYGQTAPSYWRSEACGAPEPVDLDQVGFLGMHLVMRVAGLAEPTVCEVPGWVTVDPLAGTVTPGAEQVVSVTLDSAGLAAGTHETLLCLESGDPDRPVAVVPVSLAVSGAGGGGCDETIVGVHPGPLTITDGITCLAAGALVLGEVNVGSGAGLVATAAVVQGPISVAGGATMNLTFSQVTGPVTGTGVAGPVVLFGNQVTGSVVLTGNHTGGSPVIVSGNTVIGSLSCLGNEPAPVHDGLPNTVVGGVKIGQCAEL